MPLKLLVWNIQTFTLNKISTAASRDLRSADDQLFRSSFCEMKREYILANVEYADPDIFVVIEVVSGRGKRGSLVESLGAQGCTFLHSFLKSKNKEWKLIPPIKLTNQLQINYLTSGRGSEGLMELKSEGGYTEAMAVFYRADKLDFIGPYVWPDTPSNMSKKDGKDVVNVDKKAVAPGPGVTASAYPDEWQKGLPDDNFFAGQYEFKNKAGKLLQFPKLGDRNPFFTRFQEKDGKRRIINLVSVHLPPKQKAAGSATSILLRYFSGEEKSPGAGQPKQPVYPLADNELILLAGDFNVNVMDPSDDVMRYNPTIAYSKFQVLLERENPQKSSIYYTKPNATPDKYMKYNDVLDNVLIRYGGDGAKDGAANVTILDRVATASIMTNSLPSILQLPKDRQNEVFRLPNNFGRIGPNPGTSDHLALLCTF